MPSTEPRLRARLAGPAFTLCLVLAIELAEASGLEVAGLSAVLVLAVVFAVLTGGRASGIASWVIGLGYVSYHYAEPGTLGYSTTNLERLVVDALSSGLVLIILGGIRGRLNEHMRREADLRAAVQTDHARLSAILESIGDGFFSVDTTWRYAYVNARAEALVGKGRDELLGTTIWEAFPQLRGSVWDREFRRALATQEPVHFEGFYAPLESWFETHAYPSADGLTIYLRPINDRKRAEELLQARVRQQAAVASLGQRALQETNLDRVFEAAVTILAETLDVELAKVLELEPGGETLRLRAGVGWQEGLVGSARVDTDEGSQAGYTLLSGDAVVVDDLRTEVRFRGPPLLTEHGVRSGMSATIAGSPGPFGVIGVHTRAARRFTRDDAELLRSVAQVLALAVQRHQILASLADREELFRDLAENIREVFFATSRDGKGPIYVSPAYEQLWGRPVSEAIERPESALDAIHPDDRSRVDDALAELARTGLFREEFRIRRPDGEQRWVLVRTFPVRDDEGRTTRLVGLAEDVTARSLAEQAERELAREQLSRATAEAGVRARDETLAMISHDLRNPLAAIVNGAQVLRLRTSEGDPVADAIERASRRMERLIGDLLDFGRIEADGLAVDLAPIDLGSILREVGAEASAEAARKNISVVLEGADGLAVEADAGRVMQVLGNLIDNAVKFTPPGGTIRICGAAESDDVVVSVADTGSGIAPSDVPHLFERYWQAQRGDRRGLGLGLPIAKGIVEAHGGRLWVESRPGHGTTFFIALPRQRGDDLRSDAQATGHTSSGG